MGDHPFIIVGLGNPGRKYLTTRHNIGFILVDHLAARWNAENPVNKFDSELFTLRGVEGFTESKVLLVKPQTFMNLSGKAVQKVTHFYKAPVESHLMVIYDDLDLEPGQLRIRKSGGAGGHNGIGSIIECLGTKQFPRLRIGIGRPQGRGSSFVLGQITKKEEPVFENAVLASAEALEAFLKSGIETAMNQFNVKRDI